MSHQALPVLLAEWPGYVHEADHGSAGLHAEAVSLQVSVCKPDQITTTSEPTSLTNQKPPSD